MNAIIRVKFMRVFLMVIFLAGIISVALCLTGGLRVSSSCCHNKMQGAAQNAENCLSHCAKQKTFALKTDVYFQERPEIKALFSAKADTLLSLNNPTPEISAPSKLYPNEAIPKLLPNQTYLSICLTLAPPSIV